MRKFIGRRQRWPSAEASEFPPEPAPGYEPEARIADAGYEPEVADPIADAGYEPEAADPPAGAAYEQLEAEKALLVLACIEVADQVESTMLHDQLVDALADVGVERFEPDGERFDPHVHAAAGWEGTTDPALDGRIAAVQRPGYRSGEREIRPPDVIVWRLQGAGERPS
jgi:molecular chaperone GrpE